MAFTCPPPTTLTPSLYLKCAMTIFALASSVEFMKGLT
jgi:hypothetical protein